MATTGTSMRGMPANSSKSVPARRSGGHLRGSAKPASTKTSSNSRPASSTRIRKRTALLSGTSSHSVTFSIDNVVYHQVTQADLNGNPWVFDQPFFLLLNLAVGGTWPGEPNAQTVFPATLLVDEVAVYR